MEEKNVIVHQNAHVVAKKVNLVLVKMKNAHVVVEIIAIVMKIVNVAAIIMIKKIKVPTP